MEHFYYKYPLVDVPLPNPISLRDPLFPVSQHAIAYLEQLDREADAQPDNEARSTDDLRLRVTRWRRERFQVVLELSRLAFVEYANRALQCETPSEIHIDEAFAEVARRIVALAFYVWHEHYRDRLAYADKRWLEALLTEWIQEAKGVWRRRALDSHCHELVAAGFGENWHWPTAATFLREGVWRFPPETQRPPTDTFEDVWADSSDPELRAWVDRSLAYNGSSRFVHWAETNEETGRDHREQVNANAPVFESEGQLAEERADRNQVPIIGRLPQDALARMEAETAAFMAEYLPEVEREGNKSGPAHDAELLRELVVHQFGLVARECMAVCDSVDQFEAELRSDIARFVHHGLNQYPWLADAMRQELDTGFTFFVMRANPWAQIPEAERASAWHVGAITGEALTHLALKLRAEALKNATEGGFGTQAIIRRDDNGADSTTAKPVNGANSGGTPQFAMRAAWLKERLRERSWNKHDLSRQGGPDHKTVQKVLDGVPVREDVLQKVADGLSKRNGSVSVLDIPRD